MAFTSNRHVQKDILATRKLKSSCCICRLRVNAFYHNIASWLDDRSHLSVAAVVLSVYLSNSSFPSVQGLRL